MLKGQLLTAAELALTIRGEKLEIARLGEALGLEPTRVVLKGDQLNRLPLILAQEDQWVYIVQLSEPEGKDEKMNELLAHLLTHWDALSEIAHQSKVTLELSLRSDKARISYCLMPDTLQKIVALGIPLNVSSVSWGDVL